MGGTNVSKMVTDQYNEVVSEAFVSLTSSCLEASDSTQLINVQCDPGTGPPKEDSKLCRDCFTRMHDQMINQFNTYPADRQPDVVTDLQRVVQMAVSCGTSFCKSCVLTDLSQFTTISNVENCKILDNITNRMTQKVQDQVQKTLSQKTDVLGTLAQMLGASSSQSVVDDVVNRIMTRLTTTTLDQITSQISNAQSINFSGGETSLKGISQTSAYNAVLNYLDTNNIFNDVYTQEELKQIGSLVTDDTTITRLGDIALKFTQGILGGLGKTERIVATALAGTFIALLGLAILVILFLRMTKKWRKNKS